MTSRTLIESSIDEKIIQAVMDYLERQGIIIEPNEAEQIVKIVLSHKEVNDEN